MSQDFFLYMLGNLLTTTNILSKISNSQRTDFLALSSSPQGVKTNL